MTSFCLSSITEKRRLSQLTSTNPCSSGEMVIPRNSGQQLNTHSTDKWKAEKRLTAWRIQHESHTCSERSLRIRLWSASYVQQHQQLNDKIYIHMFVYIYIEIKTYNHSRRWPYQTTATKDMPPQLRLICAQGRDYIILYLQVQECASTFPSGWIP